MYLGGRDLNPCLNPYRPFACTINVFHFISFMYITDGIPYSLSLEMNVYSFIPIEILHNTPDKIRRTEVEFNLLELDKVI